MKLEDSLLYDLYGKEFVLDMKLKELKQKLIKKYRKDKSYDKRSTEESKC